MGVTAAIIYINLTQVGGSSPMISGLDSEPGGEPRLNPGTFMMHLSSPPDSKGDHKKQYRNNV